MASGSGRANARGWLFTVIGAGTFGRQPVYSQPQFTPCFEITGTNLVSVLHNPRPVRFRELHVVGPLRSRDVVGSELGGGEVLTVRRT